MFLRPIIQSLSLRNDEMSRILCALISVLCFRSQKLSLTFLWPGPVTFDTKVAQVSQDLGWALGKHQTSLTPHTSVRGFVLACLINYLGNLPPEFRI